jgi:hypothetical protein
MVFGVGKFPRELEDKVMWKIAAISAALLVPAAASAVVVTGSITGGTTPGVFKIQQPVAVGGNDLGDPDLWAWDEKQNVLLAADLETDLGGVIAAGTRVASHGVAFDPANPALTVEGEVEFSRPILGLIWSTKKLAATDGLLGLAAITYNSPGARGLEPEDRLGTFFIGDTLFLDWTALSPGDNIRVITSAIPEPATWMLLIAGFGLVGVSARRRTTRITA